MLRWAITLASLAIGGPLSAEVHESSDSGFVVRHGIDVPADPAKAWAMLVTPEKWWDGQHSYSLDAANLSLDPRAGGCFCEVLPNPASAKAAPRGSVEHMRVIYSEMPRALRMSGALGPLQAGAGTGTLTVILKPAEPGTRILWEYAYGGYVRGDVAVMARAVDGVLAGQLIRLGRRLGAAADTGEAKASRPVPETGAGGKDDFIREMEAGISGSRDAQGTGAEGEDRVSDPGADAEEKSVNGQGFIGR